MNKSIITAVAGVAALASLTAGGAAVAAADNDVTLNVDGTSTAVHYWGGTVADVLAKHGISVGEHDVLLPAANTKLSDGQLITVRYGRQLTLTVDGQTKTVWTTAATVADALSELGLRDPNTKLSLDRSTALGREGTNLTAVTPKTFQLTADGQTLNGVTTASTVAELLTEKGLTVGDQDRLSTDPSTAVTDGISVALQRVTTQTKTTTEPVDFKTVNTDSATLAKGDTQVQTEGKAGERTITWQVVLVDGVEESSTKLSEEVTTAPVDKQVLVGTKVATVTTPATTTQTTTSSNTGSTASNAAPAANTQPATAPKPAQPAAPAVAVGGTHADWMAAAGISPADYSYVEQLIARESGWNPSAVNSSSGACGLVQALPCSKLGPNWTNPVVALQWANGYVASRYGGWAGAWAHSQATGWY